MARAEQSLGRGEYFFTPLGSGEANRSDIIILLGFNFGRTEERDKTAFLLREEAT